jgi:hypothetical protein
MKMKMIRHQNVGNELAGPFLIQRGQFRQESLAASRLSKNASAIQKVSGDKV